jgi:hypothetical protein
MKRTIAGRRRDAVLLDAGNDPFGWCMKNICRVQELMHAAAGKSSRRRSYASDPSIFVTGLFGFEFDAFALVF